MRTTRLGRRFAVLAGTTLAAVLGVALFVPGSPAAATDGTTTIGLNPGQRNSTPGQFDDSCDNIPPDKVEPGTDGWVFVLPDEKATLVSLHLTFRDTSGATVIVDIPGTSYPNGFDRQGADKAWVVLPAGWTLVDGTAEVTGASKDDFFNVTHVCQNGGSSSSPTPGGGGSSSSSGGGGGGGSSGSSPTPGTSTSGGGGGSGGGGLPITGAPTATLAGAGLVLVAAGAVLLVARRRRDRGDAAGA
jgi:LPXTG-motif cell wall-anchored protein